MDSTLPDENRPDRKSGDALGMNTTSPRRPRILLVPEGALYLAFRLPVLFRRAGWDVDLLCLSANRLVHSRYIGTAIQEAGLDSLFNRLQDILRDPHRPWQAVVVAHERMARRLIATGDPELLKRWQPGAVDPQVREFFLSKFGLEAACENHQMAVPPSRVCRTLAEIGEFGRAVGWPVIVKPPDKSGGTGVIRCNSPEELQSHHSTVVLPILAQKYIQGRRGVVEMLCSAGRPLAWLASYSIRRSHGEFSPSTARSFRAKPELQPLVEQVARFTQFEGFCGFDWIEEETTGRHHLIEFHPRPPSGFRFARFCNVNFPAAIAAWLKGEANTFPTQVQPQGGSVEAFYFPHDILRCFRQHDWRGLKSWLPGSGNCHDVFWNDPPLLAAYARPLASQAIQRLLANLGLPALYPEKEKGMAREGLI
jgi:hypothetical protein